ncbi:MAG: GNAT family N-acetyltransferase [Acidimicrobiia bacterium]|nr:GNAT family N-acetyltransferase [Acidimicrobiia bacterium]
MEIRRARREDLDEIGHIAYQSGWTSLTDSSLCRSMAPVLDEHYSPATLKRSLLAGELLVAADDRDIIGFAEIRLRNDHLHMASICMSPVHRGLGVAVRMVDAVRELGPGLPISTDVLLGSGEWEHFYEQAGFFPGETIETAVGDESLVYRRWWSTAS